MIEPSLGAVTAIVCAILYWATVALLIFKNPHRADAWIVAAGALVIWPCLLFGHVAQLVFLVPLYTVFFMHGMTLPRSLPFKTVSMAIGLTFLAWGLMVAVAMWVEPT